MKLWLCTAHGIDWEAHNYLVTETEDEAKERFYAEIEDGYGWCASVYVQEAIEIDGYNVVSVTPEQIILFKSS